MTTAQEPKVETLTLNVEGMTCASCVFHVEKALKGVPGVVGASVNLATDQAKVDYVEELTGLEAFRDAIADAGYFVQGVAGEADEETGQDRLARTKEIRTLTRKVVLAGSVGIVIMVLMYISLETLRVTEFQLNVALWLMATPVQFWAGAIFYRAAWGAAKHRTTNMNTLVAVGTTVAYGYSTMLTFFSSFFSGFCN